MFAIQIRRTLLVLLDTAASSCTGLRESARKMGSISLFVMSQRKKEWHQANNNNKIIYNVNSVEVDWLGCGFVSHLTQNRSFQTSSSGPISWLSTEKLKQTQQNKTCIHNKIYYNIKLIQKTKARFNRLLWHPVWKRRRSILVSELHKFVTYLLSYLDNYPLTAQRPTQGEQCRWNLKMDMQLGLVHHVLKLTDGWQDWHPACKKPI